MVDLKYFDSLISLLAQEQAIYAELAVLLGEERTALRAMNASLLGEIVSRKETLALRVKALDESRRILANRLGRELGLPSDEVTVTRLASLAPPALGARLNEIGQSLKEVVLECQRINKENKRAAMHGSEIMGGMVEYLIKGVDPHGAVYQAPLQGAKGAYGSSPARHEGPRLISRQV